MSAGGRAGAEAGARRDGRGRPRFYRRLDRTRRIAQAATVAFLVVVPVLNWLGVRWIMGTLYSISIGELDIADPVMALQTVLLTKEVYLPLLLAAAVPALLALVFGRVFCSWLCPYNTLLEWADRLERRFFRRHWLRARTRAAGGNPGPAAYWTVFAALLLATLVAGLPLLAWLSAPGILSSQLSQAILGLGVGLELALVAALLVAEAALARRFWCKYACPVGAMLALFRTRRTLRVERDAALCDCRSGAEPCRVACPLGLSPRAGEVYPYCFQCGACLAVCEKTGRNALRFRFSDGVPRAARGPAGAPVGGSAPRRPAAAEHAGASIHRTNDPTEEAVAP